MVDKKHLKIGIAVFAIAALVIGLSVGLTQKSDKSTNNASSSQAYGAYDIDFNTEDCLVVNSGSGKSGKSGGGTSAAADSGKSGKSGNRALYVPGTEDAEASAGMRRKLRDELLQRGLGSKSYKAGKGTKQTAAASSAGGKSEKASSSSTACYCVADATKSAKSGVAGTSEGKSGKSGGDVAGASASGKSGKSGGDVAGASASAKSGKSESDSDPSPSKSGKSESAGTSGCGKSGKSGGGSGDCSSPKSGKSAPTVGLTCSQGEPPEETTETFSTPPGIPETFSTTPIIPDEFIPSPSPTEGGTTTVATEKDAPEDTQGERPFD